MSKSIQPPGSHPNSESRTDDLEAALEQSEEKTEEDQVVEEAEANQKEPPTE